MKTGLHQWLIDNKTGWLLFDTLFYSMPLIFFFSNNVYKVGSVATALVMLLVNWMYVQCYTLFPSNSIEAHSAWLLFPVIFLASNARTFRLLAEALRYFFLFIMVSAGVWKIVTGAVFNADQMSGVLLYQHAELLSTSPGYWQTDMIEWIIEHKAAGFALFLLATFLEISFLIGFFTKKYDHLLVILFLVFLVFDHLLMRIPYYELMPYLILLRLGAMCRDLPSSAVPQQIHIRS